MLTASGTAIALGEILGNSNDLKPTGRFQSWTRTGSDLSTPITVVSLVNGTSSTIVLISIAAGTLSELRLQMLVVGTRCGYTYQQRCDLIDLFAIMITRAPRSNTRSAFLNYRNSLIADKYNINGAIPQQAIQAIDQAMDGTAATLQGVAAVAHNNLFNAGQGGHCTYNYRECAAVGKSFGHRNHHCYWAIFRCKQDMDNSSSLASVPWCGWLM